MTKRFASRIATLSAAALLLAVAGVAGAQSYHGPHAAGAAQQHHALDGPIGTGDVVMAIAGLKAQLNLNTSQQAMWDNAVAAGKAARETARLSRQKVRDTLAAELAKDSPDLAAVSAAADAARDAGAAAHRQVRDAWLNIYSTFTPDQKAIVKNVLQEGLAKSDQFRERMRQRNAG
jgi:Spy/CpxP family protein refolding chaperone